MPTAKTVPVDRPTRYEPPTAETEPLRRAAPARAAVAGVGEAPSWTTEASPADPRPARRRRRAGVIAAALILMVAVGLGAALLFIFQRPGAAQPEADPTPARTSSSTPAEESAEPETVLPAPAASAPPEEDTEPDPAPVSPEQRVVDTISGYYAMMPENRDGAWPLMTADYQENHAGGRGGYEEFWSAISDVVIADVSATGPDSGQATLTYYFRDGRVVEEVTAYRFADEGGVLKIAATEVLSSR
jgi:hypothetical protein